MRADTLTAHDAPIDEFYCDECHNWHPCDRDYIYADGCGLAFNLNAERLAELAAERDVELAWMAGAPVDAVVGF